MIRKLRVRMTLMVIFVLVLVSAGIVLATHLSGEQNIAAQAQEALSVLADGSGAPENRKDSPPPKPDGDDNGNRFGRKNDRRGGRDSLPDIRSGGDVAKAGLSNSYTVTLNEDGSVASWASDRADLYSDEQIADITRSILADGKDAGRVGTQFYRKTDNCLTVLDARLDFLSASNALRSTILIAAASCLLLSLLAWLLIRRMVRPVEDAFNKQKQFVSDASHELKTPLAVISANAEVLEQDIGENEYLGYIRSEVRRTDTLVNSLLTLARLDKGAAETAMKPFDLSRALLDVTLPFESTVFEAGKTLETDIPDGISCTGSEEQIKQLAVILLSNALKYSDEGGTIEVSLRAKGKQREIRVFNTGSFISPEDREHIFDRFWRADPAHGRETGGHGLGLAIAKTIADAHHGKIAVESREGSGTAFTVTLNA